MDITAGDTEERRKEMSRDFSSGKDGWSAIESKGVTKEIPEKDASQSIPVEISTYTKDTESGLLEIQHSLSDKLSSFDINSSVQQTQDRVIKNGGMNVSHTESGYLTDSVISRDKDCAHNSEGSNNSEQDITPCAENLITFSTSSSNTVSSDTSPVSPDQNASLGTDSSASYHTDKASGDSDQSSTAQDDHEGQVNKIYNECTEIINKTARMEQLDSLAKINLKCKREDIDDIFATNFAPVRPESLVFQGETSGVRGRSQSDVLESLTEKNHFHGDHSDSRKRSKSSGFPIPKQKEGVVISEDLLSKSLPHGKVVKSDSGLIEFIADDLQEKIRMSSPMSKTESSEVSSRRSSVLSLTSVDSMASSSMATSMTSGMSRSYPQSPDCIPPIDPMAIHEIENQARLVADSLDHMMGNLRNNLHQMSAISVGCEEAYKTSVDVTCDSVDASIKSMYALMAKCEELSVAMQPVYKLADQIREIKRLLDRFESQLGEKP